LLSSHFLPKLSFRPGFCGKDVLSNKTFWKSPHPKASIIKPVSSGPILKAMPLFGAKISFVETSALIS